MPDGVDTVIFIPHNQWIFISSSTCYVLNLNYIEMSCSSRSKLFTRVKLLDFPQIGVMELNIVTENIIIGKSNIATAIQGRKKNTAGPWLMHFLHWENVHVPNTND